MSQKRGTKSNRHAAPGQDFFALGSAAQSSVPSTSTLAQGLGKLPQKRPLVNDAAFQAPGLSVKRPNLNSPHQNVSPSMSPAPLQQSVIRSPVHSIHPPKASWEDRAIIVPSKDLRSKILEYDESDSEDMIERLLCGAAKQLREQKARPDSIIVLTLLYLAKIRPLFFCSNTIVDAFSSLLRRETLNHFIKTKSNLVPILVVNLFQNAFHDENSWPEIFLKMYIEDALGDRVWVDNEECKDFVDIIIASFKTKLPQKSQLQTSDVSNAQSSLNFHLLAGDDSLADDASSSSNPSIYSDQGTRSADMGGTLAITSRYVENEEFVIRYVGDVINDHLNRRQNVNDISRNMLKLLMVTAGIRTVRLLVMQRLDVWFQNPKLTRPAQDLLLTICMNCNENDNDTLGYLLKMRFKNKTVFNHFIICLKELLSRDDGTFDLVLFQVINNELAQIRNYNNFQIITLIFQQKPERATVVLAKVFLQIVFKKDDFLRALRLLLREIVRHLRHEHLNFLKFVETLFDETNSFSEKADFTLIDDDIKKRTPYTIIDLATNAILLSIGNNVREAFNTSRSDRREVIRAYQEQAAKIQRAALRWILETLVTRFLGNPSDSYFRKTFASCVNKVLFMDNFESYYKIDNWPAENDRAFVSRVASEVPLLSETFFYILRIAFTREFPLPPNEACELCNALVHRACNIYADHDLNYPVFQNFADPAIVVKNLFETCSYSYPESTVFPVGYTPPRMAIRDLYWRVWSQLFILCTHMPALFGRYCWNQFPTMRMLIEMAITNNFQYPPKGYEDLPSKEHQMLAVEKVKILEFENFLAVNQEINENNSYLLATLITADPQNLPRRPPPMFLEDLKNKCLRYRLSQLLYQSRSPDFLLIIIEQQQSRIGPHVLSPMPWLVELVESSENNFGLLPVQCLCEFLFGQISEEMLLSVAAPHELTKVERVRRKEKRRKQIRLVGHLQVLIQQNPPDHLNELLVYIIRRLSSVQSMARTLAYKALYLIVSINPEECLASLDETNLPSLVPPPSLDWLQTKLLKYLKSEPHIRAVCNAMIDALDFEIDPVLICEYFDFIASRTTIPDEKLVYSASALLINRSKIATHILYYSQNVLLKKKFLDSILKIFSLYIDSVFKIDFNKRKPNEWICIRFCSSPKVIAIHPLIVNGAILVLSYIDNSSSTDSMSSWGKNLFKMFFGERGNESPVAFNDFDGKNPRPLLEEWLALRLLTSNSSEIINLAIANLKSEQLIRYLDNYGLSTNAMTKILQTLDKLNTTEMKLIKSMEFDRQKKLNTLEVYWMKGISCGVKFARAQLNYKGDGKVTLEDDDSDVEMIEPPIFPSSKSRKEDRLEKDQKVDSFRKDEMIKMFKDKNMRRIIQLNRAIADELSDKNVKTKRLTKVFFSEFNANIASVIDLIVKGSFNSTFNIITSLVLKDAKHFGFNADFQNIKKTLLAVELDGRSIEETTFWNFFERFFAKEPQKGKKIKQAKKKSYNLRSHDDLDKFLRTFTFAVDSQAQNPAWCEIFKDLAVEKFYNRDTELEDSNASLQSVIFSRNRPYFLSMLLHKSNFSTLNHCIEYLLSNDEEDEEELEDEGEEEEELEEEEEEEGARKRRQRKQPQQLQQHELSNRQLNPSAILDFLTICINSPKLAIGRDSAEGSPKTCLKQDDVLQLSKDQIRKLIHYVVLENDISKRADLVVKSCCVNNATIDFVVNLLKKEYTEESKEKVALELYTRLYLHIPYIDLPSKMHEDHLQLIQEGHSFIDKITHNLITSFMFVDSPHGVNEEFIRFWELAILKIASKHPLLLIRQLPMIPALLGGKVNLLTYEAFKSQNLLKIFHKFLNILRLLRPHLWDKQSRGVMQILDLYMDFFMAYYYQPRNRRSNEDLVPLLQLFIDLLDDWLKHDPDTANIWIKSQKQGLTELSLGYPHEQNIIRSIISGLHSQNQVMLAQSCHSTLVKLRCAQTSQDKLIVALNEISKQADRTPEIAEHLLDEVRAYYLNPSTTEIAFKLSFKALQHNPTLSNSIVSTYLRCFESNSSDVLKQALDHLPKFVILAQEHRYLIMKKAFELAISGNSTALAKLSESFTALKSQYGC